MASAVSENLPPTMKKWYKTNLTKELGQHGKIFSENTSTLLSGRLLSSLASGGFLPMNWIDYGPSTTHKPKISFTEVIGHSDSATWNRMYTPFSPLPPLTHNVCHKVSVLPSDAVPYDVEDQEHGWYILNHQPLTVPSTPQSSHCKTQPDYVS